MFFSFGFFFKSLSVLTIEVERMAQTRKVPAYLVGNHMTETLSMKNIFSFVRRNCNQFIHMLVWFKIPLIGF